MLTYIARRLAVSVVVLLGIAVVSFLIIHLVPGDPARIALGGHATPEAVAQLRHQMGLDKPFGQQFLDFLGNTVTGDLGESVTFNSSVASLIGSRLAPTAILIVYGLLVALVIGVPMAIVA